jgi:bile acid-coenzyme A ligase
LSDFELPEGTLPYGARMRELAAARGGEIALVFVREDGAEDTLSWQQLEDRSNQVAHALAARGLGHGERLGIKIRNSPDHILAALAAWKLGAVPVPVRWDLPEWELGRVLGVLDPKLLIDAEDATLTASADGSIEPLADAISPNASGILSSGATGLPKVILRLVPGVYMPGASSNSLIEAYGELGPQLLVVPAPLYHNNGFMALGNLMGGDRLLLLERFNSGRLLECIEKYGVTGMVAATVMLQRLARDPAFESTDLSSLEWVMHGAAPLPDWLARQWIEAVGSEKFYVCYGSSEGAGATFARGDEYLQHPGTVGKGAMGTDLKILDDDGIEVATGEVGHIYMKSENGILATYVGDVPPIPVTEDGYATVGDMGWLDDDNYLFLADRRVDMIVSGGANVYPAEVEAAVSEHADVADVVVIGLDDAEWGKRVHAVVQLNEGADVSEETLKAYAGERLTGYKVPKTIEFVAAIPRSEATKINRAALIAQRQQVEAP